jgi:malate dehydrogenase (oxaloacetate-decarboxylating)(NADP+)
MVACGDADALLSGVGMHYPERSAPPDLGPSEAEIVSGLYARLRETRHLLWNTTVNIRPRSSRRRSRNSPDESLASASPKIAMLSFSNFGSVRHPEAEKVAKAVAILRKRDPALVMDGEMQADTAMDENILRSAYPFSVLKERANVLIFPNLSAGNIAYKLLHPPVGPRNRTPPGRIFPCILEQGPTSGASNMAAVAGIDAQQRSTREGKGWQLR